MKTKENKKGALLLLFIFFVLLSFCSCSSCLLFSLNFLTSNFWVVTSPLESSHFITGRLISSLVFRPHASKYASPFLKVSNYQVLLYANPTVHSSLVIRPKGKRYKKSTTSSTFSPSSSSSSGRPKNDGRLLLLFVCAAYYFISNL